MYRQEVPFVKCFKK